MAVGGTIVLVGEGCEVGMMGVLVILGVEDGFTGGTRFEIDETPGNIHFF